jgi:hypothetical protein
MRVAEDQARWQTIGVAYAQQCGLWWADDDYGTCKITYSNYYILI